MDGKNCIFSGAKKYGLEGSKIWWGKIYGGGGAWLQKVFLPPGTCFLRRNFPNIEEEFS